MTWFGAQPRSSVTVIDSYEDGSLSEYNDGGSDAFSITTDSGEAVDGDNYLGADGSGYVAMSSDSLANLPGGGDTWRGWVKTTSGLSSTSLYVGYLFGIQNVSADRDGSGYRVRWEPFDGAFYLQVDSGAGFSTVASDTGAGTYTAGDWWEVEVVWPNDPASTPIEASIYDAGGTQQATCSGTDAAGAYTSGGFGVHASDAPTAPEQIRWDYSRIL